MAPRRFAGRPPGVTFAARNPPEWPEGHCRWSSRANESAARTVKSCTRRQSHTNTVPKNNGRRQLTLQPHSETAIVHRTLIVFLMRVTHHQRRVTLVTHSSRTRKLSNAALFSNAHFMSTPTYEFSFLALSFVMFIICSTINKRCFHNKHFRVKSRKRVL